jgi:hypothetical protein
MEKKANVQLEAQFDDNNYNDADLISIKVSAEHVSSYANSKQFERVDGQVEVKGVQYKYVKIRHFNDSLELLCIPNLQAMKVQNAKDDFFKLVNDLQHTGQSKKGDNHAAFAKSFSTDNYTIQELFKFVNYSIAISPKSFCYTANLTNTFSLTAEQPPEHC